MPAIQLKKADWTHFQNTLLNHTPNTLLQMQQPLRSISDAGFAQASTILRNTLLLAAS